MKKLIFALLLFVCAAPMTPDPAMAQEQDEQAQQQGALLSTAFGHIRAGEPAKAVALVDPLIAAFEEQYRVDPHRIYCAQNQRLAILYAGLGASDEDDRDTLVLDSTWCRALWMKGFALIDLGRPRDALVAYQRAVELSPLYPQYFVELGYAYKELKQWDQSAGAYRQAASVAPLGFEGEERDIWLRRAWYGEAYAYIEQGRWAEAEALLRKCLEVAPGDEKVLSELRYIEDNRTDGK